MSLVHNEQTKLSATGLNGLAVAAVAVGGFAPVVAAISGGITAPVAAALVTTSLIVGLGLHFGARALLRLLKDGEP